MPAFPIAAVCEVLDSHATSLAQATDRDPTGSSWRFWRGCLTRADAGVCETRVRPLLAAVVCAMLAGSRSFAAIGEPIADLPASARARLGLTGPVPAATTVWRLLTRVDPARVATRGGWPGSLSSCLCK